MAKGDAYLEFAEIDSDGVRVFERGAFQHASGLVADSCVYSMGMGMEMEDV